MRQWAQQEIRDATKALELRVRSISELAAAYSAGEITAKEANDRFDQHQERWGEALPGASAADGRRDAEILEDMDRARATIAAARARKDRDPGGHLR